MILKTCFLSTSVKNKHTMGGRLGRLMLGSHADGSRKMCEVQQDLKFPVINLRRSANLLEVVNEM